MVPVVVSDRALIAHFFAEFFLELHHDIAPCGSKYWSCTTVVAQFWQHFIAILRGGGCVMCLQLRGSLSVTHCLKYFLRTGIIDKLVSSLFRTVTDCLSVGTKR